MQGDSNMTDAQRDLVECNVMLAPAIINRYLREQIRASGLPVEDALQCGYLGLCKAAKRYDPTRGTKFAAYAFSAVKQSVQMACITNKQLHKRVVGISAVFPTVISLDAKVCNAGAAAAECGELTLGDMIMDTSAPFTERLEEADAIKHAADWAFTRACGSDPRRRAIVLGLICGKKQHAIAWEQHTSQAQVSRIAKRFRAVFAQEYGGSNTK